MRRIWCSLHLLSDRWFPGVNNTLCVCLDEEMRHSRWLSVTLIYFLSQRRVEWYVIIINLLDEHNNIVKGVRLHTARWVQRWVWFIWGGDNPWWWQIIEACEDASEGDQVPPTIWNPLTVSPVSIRSLGSPHLHKWCFMVPVTGRYATSPASNWLPLPTSVLF